MTATIIKQAAATFRVWVRGEPQPRPQFFSTAVKASVWAVQQGFVVS